MSVSIHPTAIIHENAKIGIDVEIGAYSCIGADVIIHDHVKIHSHVVVDSHTEIGAGTEIFPFAVLGQAPQHLRFEGEASKLIIGERNIIREHVTMHRGTAIGAMETIVGNDGFFMVGTHIAHDCIVGDGVIMANGVGLGGHVEIGNHVVMGAYSAVHQFVRIGDYTMIGGKATILGDVIPFAVVTGERAHLSGLNLIGLKRRGFDKDTISALRGAYRDLFEGEGTFDDRLSALNADTQDEVVQKLLDFIANNSDRPLCHPEQT